MHIYIYIYTNLESCVFALKLSFNGAVPSTSVKWQSNYPCFFPTCQPYHTPTTVWTRPLFNAAMCMIIRKQYWTASQLTSVYNIVLLFFHLKQTLTLINFLLLLFS